MTGTGHVPNDLFRTSPLSADNVHYVKLNFGGRSLSQPDTDGILPGRAPRFARLRCRNRREVSRFIDPEWLVEFEVDAVIPGT